MPASHTELDDEIRAYIDKCLKDAVEFAPITKADRHLGLKAPSIRRLEAVDPNFPRLIRISDKKVLVDVPATAAYLRAQAGKAPRSIRGDAEQRSAEQEKPSAPPRRS